jgi:DNA-directed RNA polymerase specialized sigma subunit
LAGSTAITLTAEQAALVRSSTVVERAVRVVGPRNLMPEDELRSVAHVALCAAAQRFDASKAVPFDGFAWVVVLRELGKAHRSEWRHHKHRVVDAAREQTYGDFADLRDPGDVWADTDESTRGYLQDISDQVAGA